MYRNTFLAVAFSVLLSFIQILGITGITTQTMWQIKQQLYEYENYGSLQLTKFTVPTLALRSTWLFSSYTNNGKCDKLSGFVSIQYGGFPLVTPLNETYPPFFHLHRSYQVTLPFPTDNSTLSYRLENPVAGDWYAVSALHTPSEDRILQKGLGVHCEYYLDVVHHIVSIENVTVIASGSTASGLAQSTQACLFRFMSEGSTTKYTVKISNCACIGDISSCTASDSCPIRLSSRSQAFPIPSRTDTHSVNCSTSSDCQLEVEQPAIDDWQYVMVESLVPGNVSFSLAVDFEGCDWVHLSAVGTRIPDDRSGPSVIAMTTENPAFEQEVSDGYLRTAIPRPPEAVGNDLSVLKDVTEMNPSAHQQVTISPEHSFRAEVRDIMRGTINPSCLRLTDFGRFTETDKAFSVTFRRRYGAYPLSNLFRLTGKEVAVAAFHMETLVDNGGTLKLDANLLVSYLNDTSQIVVIELCLVKFRIPIASGLLSCPPDSPQLQVSSETGQNDSAKVYIPYPESGVWFVAMAAHCYSNVKISERALQQCRVGPITVNSTVSLSPCVDKECGSHGSCREYHSGVVHLSACACRDGYRGYGCTDDTAALSNAFQLMQILLLTLSNLFFIPAIVVSIHRRFFSEAFVYFFTMFMSSFYHACDDDSMYNLCIMPYNVLSYLDFLASIASFWVTLVTMARLPLHWTSFSYVVALLALSIGVEWDRHSLWAFLVPALVAGLIWIASWVSRCWVRRTCYPSKRRWLFFIVPGICLAILGLIIFAGLETYSNYHYTHSTWHVCMSLCIVFLLPTRPLHPIAKDHNLLSICAKGHDDVRVVAISVPVDDWPQQPQSDALFMSPVGSSNASANGDVSPKDNSLEASAEDWPLPQTDPLLTTPISTHSVLANGDVAHKDNHLKGDIEKQIYVEKTDF